MHSRSSSSTTTRAWLAVLGLGACAVATTACTSPLAEPTGASSAKLLAPKAITKAPASATTEAALGVAEWRIYRGKTSYVLTGYDANGKAVKGVALGFSGRQSGEAPALHGRMLDGSSFAARHEFGGSTRASGSVSRSTKTFVDRALADLDAAHTARWGKPRLPAGGAAPTLPGGVDPGGLDPGACGGDMMQILMSGMQCLMQSGAGGAAGKPDPSALLQCIQAAATAAGAGGASCGAAQPGAPGADPAGATDPAGDPQGADAADQASQNTTCASCPTDGGYGDLGVDPATGGVYGNDQGPGAPFAGY